MINTLDLFSGIGGNSLGLQGYINTVAYCEQDNHARAVLLSRMRDGLLPNVPIFKDVNTLSLSDLPARPDMIVAGFPCQDISVAGKGEGIKEGNRSGLFFQIMRLTDEIQPRLLFLENVPAIRTRGLDIVLRELTERGYDCRWTMLSAAQVGAPHKRERWFLLAYSNQGRLSQEGSEQSSAGITGSSKDVADSESERHKTGLQSGPIGSESIDGWSPEDNTGSTEPNLGGVVDGSSNGMDQGVPRYLDRSYWQEEPEGIPRVTEEKEQRVERIKRLGNGVVPLQARQAFEKLMLGKEVEG